MTKRTKPQDFRGASIKSILQCSEDRFCLTMNNGNEHLVTVEQIGEDWLRLHNENQALWAIIHATEAKTELATRIKPEKFDLKGLCACGEKEYQ